MSKAINPVLTDIANFKHLFHLDTQFGDIDVLGHINNLSVARYYESARARFQMTVFGDDLYATDNPLKIVLVDNKTAYHAELHFPDALVVGSVFSRIGNSSYVCTQVLFRERICVGVCEATLVAMVSGKPTPLHEEHRKKMQDNFIIL